MRYLNPYRLLHLADQQPPETAVVQQIAERLSRLRDEAAKAPVYVADYKLSADEINRLLTEWQDASLREHHRAVLQYRKLFNFLEYGHLGLFREPESQQHPLWQDVAFVEFIQPYLSAIYSETMLAAVRQRDTPTIELLSKHHLPLAAPADQLEQQDTAHFDPVIEYLKTNTNDLQQLTMLESLPAMSERELLSYLPDKSIEIYNALPDQFADLRNQLGAAIQHLAVFLNNELGRGDGAEALVKQGLKLKLDAPIQRQLESMLAYHAKGNGFPLWLVIGLGLIALLFFIQYLEK